MIVWNPSFPKPPIQRKGVTIRHISKSFLMDSKLQTSFMIGSTSRLQDTVVIRTAVSQCLVTKGREVYQLSGPAMSLSPRWLLLFMLKGCFDLI